MHIEGLRDHCLAKPGAEEGFPFGPDVIVFTVLRKAFLLCQLDSNPVQFNVKCDPAQVDELREQYACVQPGYHMNKKHWNTIIVDGSVPNRQLKEWIDDSYHLIVSALPRRQQDMLKKL